MKSRYSRTNDGPGFLRGRPSPHTNPCHNPIPALILLAVVLSAAAGSAEAQAPECPDPNDNCGQVVAEVAPGAFPRIQLRGFPGVFGSQGQDSTVSRKVTLTWTRDLALEQQLLADTLGGGFGGYNVYRVFTDRDTCQIELIRRFVYKDTLLWHFGDSQAEVSFVDPDSAGNMVKICTPAIDPFTLEVIPNSCPRPGDSVFVFVSPPPPPDGFPIYYAVVYAADKSLAAGAFEDLFVPDSGDGYARCGTPGDRTTCCNLNHRALNLMTAPVFTTGPTRTDLERIIVVPNPYQGRERWDPPGSHRIEFRGLPSVAEIRIYTVAGDLVRILEHNNPASGSAGWDLRNADGRDVTSGIYLYRITSPASAGNPRGFDFSNHFVVIR